jgi:hypothetical protein
MPNWVFNTVVVSGDKLELDKLQAQLNQPFEKHFPDSNFNQETKEWEHTPSTQVYSNPVFAFWNVVRPTDLEAYYGEEKEKVGLDNFMADFNNAIATGESWYYWNLRNWGTKWDVSVTDGEKYSDTSLEVMDDETILYRFHTAWSPVHEIFNILSEQYPSLEFDYEYEEEQGWGGSALWVDGYLVGEEQYDIPNSHYDYEKRDRECHCSEGEAVDWAYSDCPVDTEKYEWNSDNHNWVEKQGVEA